MIMTTVHLPKNCYVVTTKKPKSLYALHTKTSSRVLCFKHISEATRCERTLVLYRNKYGKWPRRLIQNNTFNDVELSASERPSLQECKNLLEIQYAETQDIVQLCSTFAIGLIMCEKFEVGGGKLHIKGTNVHEFEPELETKKQILEGVYNDT